MACVVKREAGVTGRELSAEDSSDILRAYKAVFTCQGRDFMMTLNYEWRCCDESGKAVDFTTLVTPLFDLPVATISLSCLTKLEIPDNFKVVIEMILNMKIVGTVG